MNRRQFLSRGPLGLFVTPSLVMATGQSHPRPSSALNRWIKITARLDDEHPSFSRYDKIVGSYVWVDFDRATGAYEISSEYDRIYSWPLANILLRRDEEIPDDWPSDPDAPPLPEDLVWQEQNGHVYARRGESQTWIFPRYVICAVTRDILENWFSDRPRDRRDECSTHWKYFDLLTLESLECGVDDPFFDSELLKTGYLV